MNNRKKSEYLRKYLDKELDGSKKLKVRFLKYKETNRTDNIKRLDGKQTILFILKFVVVITCLVLIISDFVDLFKTVIDLWSETNILIRDLLKAEIKVISRYIFIFCFMLVFTLANIGQQWNRIRKNQE
ncbi:MAG: hypothetical protein GF364_00330 [Candidatus Lokiarchaeota archaeon]|nr:hypothetical protein [Candidatus Lokiarchaeota archaeon]